jgi:hypothetical protein
MWRIYVGGLLMGFAIGGFTVWCAVLTLVPPSVRSNLTLFPLVLLPFALAGEALRIRASRLAKKERPV